MTTPIFSLFNLDVAELRRSPALLERAQALKLHADVDILAPQADLDWLASKGLRCIAKGDSVMRTPGDRDRYLYPHIIRPAAQRLRGICDGVEMVDEVKQDPKDYPDAWAFIGWWRDESGPPLAWPGLETSRWEKLPGVADYISRQWLWKTCKKGSDRLARLAGSLHRAATETRPMSALIDASGLIAEMRPSGKIVPLYGRKKQPSGLNILKQIRLAHSMGATLYRIWAWHWALWERQIARATPGNPRELLYGLTLGDHRWEHIGKAIGEVRESVAQVA